MSNQIEKLKTDFLVNAVKIEASPLLDKVLQFVCFIPANLKEIYLICSLNEFKPKNCLILLNNSKQAIK